VTAPSTAPRLFSILTPVYDTPAPYLEELARSLASQECDDFEWVVLDNGSADEETVSVLDRLGGRASTVLRRVSANVGIVRGMAECLRAARGAYVLPVDADDVLTPDALAVMAETIRREGRADLVYSDEDLLIDGVCRHPFARPDWDPVLNLCSSYVWHLTAFRSDLARTLGVYSDRAASHCHDWDTVMRFASAGRRIGAGTPGRSPTGRRRPPSHWTASDTFSGVTWPGAPCPTASTWPNSRSTAAHRSPGSSAAGSRPRRSTSW